MPVPPVASSKHQQLVSYITRKLRASENAITPRHEHWRRAERTYRLYVDPSEVQEPAEAVTAEGELLYTSPTSIVVPLSYAITQTVVAFWISLFTSDKLPFRITPRDPNSAGPARAQELLLSYQLDYVGYIPLLYGWLLDSCRYGLGIVKNSWDTIERIQTVRRFLDLPGPDGTPVRFQIKEKRDVLEYEGNVPELIDPFTWRPDHRWPVGQFQRGNFCGEAIYRSYFELLRQQDSDIYSNVEEIPRRTAEHFKEQLSDRDRIIDTNRYFGLSYEDKDGLVLVEELSVDLIPADYELSPSTRVERWLLTLANRAVVIRADPYPYDHHEYPYAAIESSPDFHALMNPGLIEIMEPVHQHITWFLNSMIENARKSLNDRMIVDPSVVNMEDVLSPSAGKAIRINKQYWGVPGAIDQAIKQLKVEDISSQNFRHIGFLIDLLQRVSAATETIQGQIEDEERTATEISSAATQGATRLRVMARLFATLGLTPLARQMVQNNMQLLTEKTYLSITGGLEQDFQGIGRAVGGEGVMIGPEDIQGLFSFPISDASAPLDPVRFARTWVQIMQVSLQNPAMAQVINHPEIWKEMIRAMGIQDPSRFLMPQQAQVMPDQQIEQQVQQGNLTALPPQRTPIPMQQQRQSIQGEERRPFNGATQ